MNIFVILIMGLMLASYQYFTSKRGAETQLNKDELILQANISCMKQYHNFASSVNERILSEQNLKGKEKNQAEYTCKGSDEIEVNKYCLNGAGAKTPCNNHSTSMHCVSTTKWIALTKKTTYLTTHILKAGVSIAKDNKVKDKFIEIRPAPKANKEQNYIAMALLTCVDIEKVNKVNKFNKQCKEGEHALPNPDGTFKCVKSSDLSPCTAHEKEQDTSTGNNCTKLPTNKFCCPKDAQNIQCDFDKKPIWNTKLRFYECSDGTDYCQNKAGFMLIKDDKLKQIPNIPMKRIANAWTTKYNKTTSEFTCIPKPNEFIKSCKEIARTINNKDYRYLHVKELAEVKGTLVKDEVTNSPEYNKPICVLSYKKNSNAVENCSVCEKVEFDTTNNKWQCKQTTTFKELTPNIIDELKGLINGRNDKGIAGCFSNCSTEQIDAMKTGIFNTEKWGVRYNKTTRVWDCFNCSNDTYNNACSASSTKKKNQCGGQDIKVTVGNCKQDTKGKCVPKSCSTEYQVLIDGQCYTKWCNNNLPTFAKIGKPKDSCCPNEATWMLFNEKLTCVYCVRPPATRIEYIE